MADCLRAQGNEKDIARDLLLFITSYLPLAPGGDIPYELEARTTNTVQSQPVRQDLHVIGHSLGAQSAILISAHAPDLFASLTIIDPAIIPNGKVLKAFQALPKDVLCTGLSYTYPNREALRQVIKKNRRTRGWDDRITNIFVERGTIDNEDGSIRLVSHPQLEWALYYDQETPTHAYDRLSDLTVPLNAIMPSRPFAVPPKMFAADVGKLKQRTQVTWIEKATHQLPFEKVDECSDIVVKWLKIMDTARASKL